MLNTLYTPLTQTHYCHCFKDKFCEMRKSITAQVPLRVRTQRTFTHKGRQTVHNSTKVKSKSVLTDFTCRGSHDCLTPAPQRPHLSPSAGRTEGHYAAGHVRLSQHTARPTCTCCFTAAQRKMPGLAMNPNVLSWGIAVPKPTEQPSSSGRLCRKWGQEAGEAS